MERPWLLLCRVLRVDVPGGGGGNGLGVDAEADALEHNAGVGGAEDHVEAAAAQAHQAQEAGVEEAEHHVVAADALAQEAQNAGAGVEEAADAVAQQAQNAEVEEGEAADALALGAQNAGFVADALAQAQMLLEQSVINVNTDIEVSQAAHAIMRAQDGGESDLTVTVAPPPLVSSLTTGPHAHPDPESPDMFPYIVATGRFCLLVHFAVAPSHGTTFGQVPNSSHLVVVRDFLREVGGVQIAAYADHIPDRAEGQVGIPALRNIESVGLVCYQEGEAAGGIQIAELIVPTGAAEAAVVVYSGAEIDDDDWESNSFDNPLLPEDHVRDWVPHGTVTVNSTVFWYDLSWGLISCDLSLPREEQALDYHRLPPGRVLRAGAGLMLDLHGRRCVAVSENLVRYVETILSPNHQAQAATVNMWYRDLEADDPIWRTNYRVSFGEIWGHHSYEQTGLPRIIPMLVGVSPVDSRVIYFSLDQRLFGVNVPERTVVHWEEYDPLNRPGPADEPDTSRYFIPWNLDANAAINIGHHPENPSDHGDSSDRGPADEGEIDYESPLSD